MKESAALLAALILLAGCNSAPPSMNLLAPYGAKRVPPPATGSFARPDNYYQPSNRSGFSATGETPAYATGETSKSGQTASGLTAAPRAASADGLTSAPKSESGIPASGVQLVSMDGSPVTSAGGSQKTSTSTTGEPPIRIVAAPRTSTTAAPQLNGMVVNDATQPAEPAPFTPAGQVKDLSQYPQAARAADTRAGTVGGSVGSRPVLHVGVEFCRLANALGLHSTVQAFIAGLRPYCARCREFRGGCCFVAIHSCSVA